MILPGIRRRSTSPASHAAAENNLPGLLVGELQMGFQDLAFPPFRASSYITFLKNNSRGEDLRTATCYKTAVGGKQGHAT